MTTRWIIVRTDRPPVCVEFEGDTYQACTRAGEIARECGWACVLLGNVYDSWHLFGVYGTAGRAPQEKANGAKQP